MVNSTEVEKEILLQYSRQARGLMKKVFASARGSAILATLTEGISKLSGPQWVQKVDNLRM
jgi:hypothetical protein